MKRKLAWLMLPLALLVALWLVKRELNQNAIYLLSRYPKSEAFDSVIAWHLKVKPNNIERMAFFATWFYQGKPYVQMKSQTSVKGQVFYQRDVYNWAHQASGSSVLTRKQLSDLKSLLRKMPPSSAPSSLRHLLILTFQEGATYQTRLYDRTQLPPQVRSIYKITAAPLYKN